MSSTTTRNADDAANSSRSTVARVTSTIEERVTDGSLAVLAGGATFGLALRTLRRSKARAVLLGLAAAGLVGLGARQLHDAGTEADVETGADARHDESGEKLVSDSAHAQSQQSIGAGRTADETRATAQSETEPNPRGMSDRDDVETDDAGEIDFEAETDAESGRKTHLEDEDAHDPRLHPEDDDEPTEIDLSSSAMADEASEATGPHPEQAFPAQEGTDPEPSAPKAPERTGEGAVAPADSDDAERSPESESEDTDDESVDSDDDGPETASRDADSTDESGDSPDDDSDAADDGDTG